MKRKHVHLLEVARALNLQSSIPDKYWDQCILTLCYLTNLLFLVVLNEKSSYEMLYGKSPSLEHLHMFGCLRYVTNLGAMDKLAPRSITVVLNEYSPNQKGYKLLNLQTWSYLSTKILCQNKENIFPSEYHPLISQIPTQAPLDLQNDERMWLPQKKDHVDDMPIIYESSDV